ncbi:MAG: SDR family NAD(P)-dependent oxidoreductase, partial [Gammaproteobacteria bacterium]|nr:SDR family NAD(P)-dependent oxidoreductase [Gammaproteobacteria bacterium]
RRRSQRKAGGQGKMLAVGRTAEEARTMLAGYAEQVAFAGVNSPSAMTLSGDSEALEKIAAKLEAKGVFNRFLRVELAYHSHIMEPLKDELRESLSMLRPKVPSIPFYSTVLGRLVEEAACDAEYWCKNIRQPVLFAKSIENLINDGCLLFIEIGPHPILSASIKECLSHHGVKGNVITSLHRKQPERATLREALGSLYTINSPVDFKKFYGTGNYVRLPGYPWQRETYWNESEESVHDRLGSPEHPLLGEPLIAPTSNNLSWENVLNKNFLPYLDDHCIEGAVVLPGAAYIEIGLAIHKEAGKQKEHAKEYALEEIELHRALVMDANDEPVLHLNYDRKTHEYTVHSRSRDDKSNWTLHATGSISMLQISRADPLNLDDIRGRCQTSVDSDTLYAQLHKRGLQYGPYFQGIRHFWKGTDEVLAQIEGHKALRADDNDYRLHPTLLDAGFQSLIALLDNNAAPYVPVSLRQFRFHASPKTRCWSYGRLTKQRAGFIEADITLCDDDGNVLAEVNELRCQALTAGKSEEHEDWKQWTYEFVWKQAEKADAAETCTPGRWLLFSDQGAVGEPLAEQLLSRGAEGIIRVRPGTAFQQENAAQFQIRRDSKEDMQRLLETVRNSFDKLVYLWGLDAPADKDDPTGTADGIACLHLIQALAQTESPETRSFFLITRGAQPVSSEECSLAPAQAPLVGLVRVAINEHPDIRFHLIDIDPDKKADKEPDNLPFLTEELLAENPDEEIARRGTDRFVHRLVQTQVKEPEPISAAPGFPYELEMGTPGLIESFRFREKQRRAPGSGEVEIEIHAASLNYKDILKATKALPDVRSKDSFYGGSLGMEAAGVIVRTGKEVEGYRPGNAVVVSLPKAFSSYITLPVDFLYLVPKLDNISHEEGAGVTRVFVTAYYGLHYAARLQPGEKVLIHAATGGVGLAAIQVAQWIGAEIYATVDSPDKHDYLRSLGIKHIMDYRSLDFADQIMALTHGKGVDVVLNSVSGDIALKNLAILALFGRFIEITKQDITQHNRLPTRLLSRNMTFVFVSLDVMMETRPKLFRQMLHETWGLFMSRDFTPLPVKVFPAAQTADAFNYMIQSKHIGKIAISMRDTQALSVLPMAMEQTLFKPDSTYMITGGFGGFGLEAAKWMTALGVKNLVLVGRRGAATEEARQTVQELEKAGAKVFTAAADIAQESQMARLMSEIDAAMPPLKGIMHAAAVLDDGQIVELTDAQFSKVMAPKALGAWHLHRHTQNMPLDFFVLFSSVSALIGNSRQSNYVAANVFLDTLACHRRAHGLPATSINWGALADTGMAARNKETGEYLERMGIKGISSVQAMKALAHILYWKPSQNGIIDMDWGKWGQFNPVWAASPRFSHLIAKKQEKGEDSAINTLRRNLLGMDAEERKEMLAFLMAELVAETMRLPTDNVDFHQPITNMGMDSLMATELQNAIHLKFDVKLSSLELLKGNTTIAWIAEQLIVKMDIMGDKTTMKESHTDDVFPSEKEVMEQVDDLSNEEVDDLLNKLLEEKEV